MSQKEAKKHNKSLFKKIILSVVGLLLIFIMLFIVLNLVGVSTTTMVVKNSVKPVISDRVKQGKANTIEIREENQHFTIYANKFNATVDKNSTAPETVNSYVKILQLTDIHIGGGFMSIGKDAMAVNACKKMIEWANPDMIVVTGDALYPIPVQSGSINNGKTARLFIDMMNSFKIPWAFVYGNHDTESFATSSKAKISKLLEETKYNPAKGKYCLYSPGPQFEGANETPLGNYRIDIKDKSTSKLVHSLIFMDSNRYYSENGKGFSFFSYDKIHDDQVAWYSKQIDEIKSMNPKVVSSLFFHIPLPQYLISWRQIIGADKDENINTENRRKIFSDTNKEFVLDNSKSKYYGGDMQEASKTDRLVISCPNEDIENYNNMYNAIKEKGSTKYLYCGHDHDNNFSIATEDGVRLTYSKSIDYLAYPGISKRTFQRGATLILISQGSLPSVTKHMIYEKKLVDTNNDSIYEMNTVKDKLEDVKQILKK